MSVADLITVTRMLIADRKKIIRNLQLGVGDGHENIFRVPILTVQALADGTPDLNITTFDPDTSAYVDLTVADFDYETGDVRISPVPESGQVIIGYFSFVTFTDAEITLILNRPEVCSDPYTAAAVLIYSILADTSRFISFTQGNAKYDLSKIPERLGKLVESYLKMSPITGESIAVPFVPDVLSRLDYISVPLVYAGTPYARF